MKLALDFLLTVIAELHETEEVRGGPNYVILSSLRLINYKELKENSKKIIIETLIQDCENTPLLISIIKNPRILKKAHIYIASKNLCENTEEVNNINSEFKDAINKLFNLERDFCQVKCINKDVLDDALISLRLYLKFDDTLDIMIKVFSKLLESIPKETLWQSFLNSTKCGSGERSNIQSIISSFSNWGIIGNSVEKCLKVLEIKPSQEREKAIIEVLKELIEDNQLQAFTKLCGIDKTISEAQGNEDT